MPPNPLQPTAVHVGGNKNTTFLVNENTGLYYKQGTDPNKAASRLEDIYAWSRQNNIEPENLLNINGSYYPYRVSSDGQITTALKDANGNNTSVTMPVDDFVKKYQPRTYFAPETKPKVDQPLPPSPANSEVKPVVENNNTPSPTPNPKKQIILLSEHVGENGRVNRNTIVRHGYDEFYINGQKLDPEKAQEFLQSANSVKVMDNNGQLIGDVNTDNYRGEISYIKTNPTPIPTMIVDKTDAYGVENNLYPTGINRETQGTMFNTQTQKYETAPPIVKEHVPLETNVPKSNLLNLNSRDVYKSRFDFSKAGKEKVPNQSSEPTVNNNSTPPNPSMKPDFYLFIANGKRYRVAPDASGKYVLFDEKEPTKILETYNTPYEANNSTLLGGTQPYEVYVKGDGTLVVYRNEGNDNGTMIQYDPNTFAVVKKSPVPEFLKEYEANKSLPPSPAKSNYQSKIKPDRIVVQFPNGQGSVWHLDEKTGLYKTTDEYGRVIEDSGLDYNTLTEVTEKKGGTLSLTVYDERGFGTSFTINKETGDVELYDYDGINKTVIREDDFLKKHPYAARPTSVNQTSNNTATTNTNTTQNTANTTTISPTSTTTPPSPTTGGSSSITINSKTIARGGNNDPETIKQAKIAKGLKPDAKDEELFDLLEKESKEGTGKGERYNSVASANIPQDMVDAARSNTNLEFTTTVLPSSTGKAYRGNVVSEADVVTEISPSSGKTALIKERIDPYYWERNNSKSRLNVDHVRPRVREEHLIEAKKQSDNASRKIKLQDVVDEEVRDLTDKRDERKASREHEKERVLHLAEMKLRDPDANMREFLETPRMARKYEREVKKAVRFNNRTGKPYEEYFNPPAKVPVDRIGRINDRVERGVDRISAQDVIDTNVVPEEIPSPIQVPTEKKYGGLVKANNGLDFGQKTYELDQSGLGNLTYKNNDNPDLGTYGNLHGVTQNPGGTLLKEKITPLALSESDPEEKPVLKLAPGEREYEYNPYKLQTYGNILQHRANMLPVMYNTAKSLFDKAEVQKPFYNNQDMAYLQGLRRNMISPNMQYVIDNRTAMNEGIRGTARGSGQLLNSMQANYSNANRAMNDEMYKSQVANQQQMNTYLQGLNTVGDSRRQIDTLVDEKNRAHRLAFEQFQRDALESGEKALINKGQLHNRELENHLGIQGYLNQIASDYKFVYDKHGIPYVKFINKQTGAVEQMPAKLLQSKLTADQEAQKKAAEEEIERRQKQNHGTKSGASTIQDDNSVITGTKRASGGKIYKRRFL